MFNLLLIWYLMGLIPLCIAAATDYYRWPHQGIDVSHLLKGLLLSILGPVFGLVVLWIGIDQLAGTTIFKKKD